MSKRTPPITAKELAASLAKDPAHRARREEREKVRIAALAKYRHDIAPVVKALHDVGIAVDDVRASQLQALHAYPKALPVLLDHIEKPYPHKVLWVIANSLAVPEARSAWPLLVAAYKRAESPAPGSPGDGMGLKDGLANALAATVTSETIDTLIGLAKDPSHGSSRLLLLRGLRRSRAPQAKRAIEELAWDPQLAVEIASWRRKGPSH